MVWDQYLSSVDKIVLTTLTIIQVSCKSHFVKVIVYRAKLSGESSSASGSRVQDLEFQTRIFVDRFFGEVIVLF